MFDELRETLFGAPVGVRVEDQPIRVQHAGAINVRTDESSTVTVRVDDSEQAGGPLAEMVRLDAIAVVVLQVAVGAFVAGLVLAFTISEDLEFRRILIAASTLIGMAGYVAAWALRISPLNRKSQSLVLTGELERKRRETTLSLFGLLAVLVLAALAAVAVVRPNADPPEQAPVVTVQPPGG
jgi:hypothetical protein